MVIVGEGRDHVEGDDLGADVIDHGNAEVDPDRQPVAAHPLLAVVRDQLVADDVEEIARVSVQVAGVGQHDHDVHVAQRFGLRAPHVRSGEEVLLDVQRASGSYA